MIRLEFGTGRICCGGANCDVSLTSFPLWNGHFTIQGLQIRDVRVKAANFDQHRIQATAMQPRLGATGC